MIKESDSSQKLKNQMKDLPPKIKEQMEKNNIEVESHEKRVQRAKKAAEEIKENPILNAKTTKKAKEALGKIRGYEYE